MASQNLDQCTPEQIDSYCKLYTKVVEDEGEAAALAKLPLRLKKKLLVNEKLYRSACPQGA